jgi:hypothetical protein
MSVDQGWGSIIARQRSMVGWADVASASTSGATRMHTRHQNHHTGETMAVTVAARTRVWQLCGMPFASSLSLL